MYEGRSGKHRSLWLCYSLGNNLFSLLSMKAFNKIIRERKM